MARILLVEYSSLLRPAMRDLLQMDGHTVITAVHSMEAFALLKNGQGVDLVITNFVMPEMDGLTLVRYLRADERFKSVPIVIFAVDGDLQVRDQAIAAGADVCLLPPITVAGFKSTINRMLN